MEKQNLNLPVGYLLERTTRVVKLRFHRLFKEKNMDLTPEQWIVLDILHQSDSMSQKQLGEHSFKDAPTISRIVKGLVVRSMIQIKAGEEDKRVQNISLTKTGVLTVEKLLPEIEKIRATGLEGLSPKEYKMFNSIMDKIFQNYSI